MLFLENGVNSVEKAANFRARREKKSFSRSWWRQILEAFSYVYENTLWPRIVGITAPVMAEERSFMLTVILQR